MIETNSLESQERRSRQERSKSRPKTATDVSKNNTTQSQRQTPLILETA